MSSSQPITSLTASALIAASSNILKSHDYQEITTRASEWDSATTRLFEDAYNIVGVVAYETVGDLLDNWTRQQGSLVDLISRFVGREEAKAWDGYLVLLSPARSSTLDGAIDAIRYNTSRVRKLVATGNELRFPSDVGRVLSPLLPLDHGHNKLGHVSIFDSLPNLVTAEAERAAIMALADAFKNQAPLMEALHQLKVSL